MAEFKSAVAASRMAMDELRKSLGEVLVSRKIYRLPLGSGEFLKVPKELDTLSATDVFCWAEVISKLIYPPQETDGDKE